MHGNKDNIANKRDGALNLTNLNKLKMKKATIFPWLQLRPEGYIETFRSNSESCCYFCKIQPEILLILKRFCEQLALLNSLLLFFFLHEFQISLLSLVNYKENKFACKIIIQYVNNTLNLIVCLAIFAK